MHVRRRLTKWGNGYGIRITVKEAKQLGLQAGQDIDADLQPSPAQNDLSELPVFHLGGDYEIDDVLADDYEETHARR